MGPGGLASPENMLTSLMFRRIAAAALIAIAVNGLSAQEGESTQEMDPESPYDNVQVLARAMQLIRQDYVDDGKISYRDLTYSALRGMLAELDPHSQFMEPRDFRGMQEDTRSEFGGLGVVVTMEDGALTIVNPMEDSPGFEAGLKPGDRVLRINGTSTEKLNLVQAVDKLRGEAGEKVTLTIQRPSTKEIKDYDLTRVVIKVKSVKDAQILFFLRSIGPQSRVRAHHAVQRTDCRRVGKDARQTGKGRNASPRSRSALQSRRSAQQRRGCRRSFSAAGDQGGLNGRPACRAASIGRRPAQARRGLILLLSLSITPAPAGRKLWRAP